MSSSPYRRVTVKIENVNLAMVLATDIQYIRFKSCGKYLCTLYKCMGVCLQILQTKGLERRLVAACFRHARIMMTIGLPPHTQNTLKNLFFKLLNNDDEK